jgi:hypothetical protein
MLADRIKVTTATTGTGALTLSATGVRDSTNGDCLAPAENLNIIANRLVSYVITSGGNWARGRGIISSDGLTLTRANNEKSWNGTTYAYGALSLTGTSTVFIDALCEDVIAGTWGANIAANYGAFLN